MLQKSLGKYLSCILPLPLELEGQTNGPLRTEEYWEAPPHELTRTASRVSRIFRIGFHGKDTPSNPVDAIPERDIVCCARGDAVNVGPLIVRR